MAPDALQEIVLLTGTDSHEYDSDIEDVTFRLSATPFDSPELVLRAVDPAGSVITTDRFDTEFLSDVLERTRMNCRVARTIERELDSDADPEDVDAVLDQVWSDLASDRLVICDGPTKSALEDIQQVVYTPGDPRPWTVVHGRERFDQQSRSFVQSLVRIGPENMGAGADPPNTPPDPSLTNEPARWRAFARVVEEIATVGEQPSRREHLDLTVPEHLDRLPDHVLCDASYDELVALVDECDQRSGGPNSVEGRLRSASDHRPATSLLKAFIEENGLSPAPA